MHEAAAVARSIVSEENKKKDSVKRVKCICPRKKVEGRRKAERRIAAINESEGISDFWPSSFTRLSEHSNLSPHSEPRGI